MSFVQRRRCFINILVIGNGFDLAHGLPTGYPDFLGFCKMVKAVYSRKKNGNADEVWKELGIKLKSEINIERLKMKFIALYSISVVSKQEEGIQTNTIYDEFYSNIDENFWIEYFLQNLIYQKENWIDFEREISKVIQSLDDDMEFDEGRRYDINDIVMDLTNEYLEQKYSKYLWTYRSMTGLTEGKSESITFGKIRDKMQVDLCRLIRALEIYLTDYVEKMECNINSSDIKSIYFDGVLSFNYTNTYEKLYDWKHLADYDYIHGQANLNNIIENNNMVLGIDEYLPKNRRDKEIEFIGFKKFYQRIYKETGCEYKNWVDDIHSDKPIRNRIYAGFDEKGNQVVELVHAKHHQLSKRKIQFTYIYFWTFFGCNRWRYFERVNFE